MGTVSLHKKADEFAEASNWRSLFELLVTLLGAAISLTTLYFSYMYSLWMVYILFSFIGSAFMVKIFILFHDCTHHSMFNQRWLNVWTGRFLSLFITMPYTAWKIEHDDHHSHVVDMEKIYKGDILLLTVEQYERLGFAGKFGYKIFRHPIFILIFTPFLYFFIKSRFPTMKNRTHTISVLVTNIFVCLIYIPVLLYFGFWTTVFVFGLPAYFGGMIGIALFYLQHDYPEVQWYKTKDWNHEKASLHGSSLIVLPQPFEWLTHAIGYHHIHHLNSNIPGYRLRECYDAVPAFRQVTPLSWRDVIEAFTLKLWSYDQNKLITFREYRAAKTNV